jgi:hypothetical protein
MVVAVRAVMVPLPPRSPRGAFGPGILDRPAGGVAVPPEGLLVDGPAEGDVVVVEPLAADATP